VHHPTIDVIVGGFWVPRARGGWAHEVGTRTGVSITCKIKCVFGSRTTVFCVARISRTYCPVAVILTAVPAVERIVRAKSSQAHAAAAPARAQARRRRLEHLATPPSQRDKTIGVVKDTAIGGVGGAAVGAAGGAIAGGGRGAGTGAAIGGLIGAVGGTLYGLNDIHKNNQEAQAAYARCMQAHGHTG
jgi:outer membrane lipoprotein SlyB